MAGFTYASSGHSSTPSSGGGGAFGFVKNLVHDIGDAARGTPEGIVQLAEHPIRTTENMAKATWQEWSPLFHGHVGEFGHQFYQHPLAPMLDILTVFTGGASLGAKLGVKLGETGAIGADSALYKFSHMPRTLKVEAPSTKASAEVGGHALERSYTKLLPKNPVYNKAYRSALSFADKHGAIPDWFGTPGVYKRLEFSDWSNSRLALAAQMSAMMKAGQVFDKAGHTEWKTLEQQLFQNNHSDLFANSHEITLQELVDHYHGNIPHGYAPVKPVEAMNFNRPLYKSWATNVDQFANHVQGLSKKFLGKPGEWNKYVYENADGVQALKLAHKRAYDTTLADGGKSVHLLHTLYRYPTAIWKYVMVGASPRTVVDNTVGNWLMYTMRQGGEHGLHGFVEAVRHTRGERKAMQMLRETGKLPEDVSYFRHFKGELQGNTYGTATLGASGRKDVGTEGALSKMYKHSLYPLVHKYADVPVRAASISAYLKGHDLVKGLERSGMSFAEAADHALTHSPTLRDEAIQHGRTVAGNYMSLSPTEHILRDTVPFYLWDKHIVMHAANMLRDRPAVVTAGSALGQQGANATRSQLGDIPDWMIGSVPFGIGQPKSDKGRAQLLNTTGLNPYSSVPDLVGLAQALTTGHTEDKPGDAILGTVNPVIKAFVEQTMGQTATGAPVHGHGGVIPSMLTDIFNSLRPVQGIREAAGAGPSSTSKSGTPRLYKSDLHSIISTIAGFPLQQADLQHAIELEQKIKNGGKKPKKGHGYTYAKR